MITVEKLPSVALEYMVKFLSAKDLISCCTVSRSWRRVFNSDVFWKKRCNKALVKYLETTKSRLELPHEELPPEAPLAPLHGWRLNFVMEQTLWNNWRKGQYQLDEIEFELDDSIDYNIKVECVNNDFVFLHTTFETQVWDIKKDPVNVMTIPFCLTEMWEKNLYKFKDNKLIVVQCNVVQVYNVCLENKTSTLDFVFFFDKPEEFSSNIPKEKDINELFVETSYSIAEDVECIICGDFFIGVVTESSQLKNPKIHVWNWIERKKIKEELFSVSTGNDEVTDITLKVSDTNADEILLISDRNNRNLRSDFEIYNFTQQAFTKKLKLASGDGLLCGDYLLHWAQFTILAFNLQNSSDVPISLYTDEENLRAWKVCKELLMVANGRKIEFFSFADEIRKLETVLHLDYNLSDFNVVGQKFLSTYDMGYSAKEMWELSIDNKSQSKEENLKKIISLPDDIGVFRSSNEVLTKVVFEKANKLIVLTFW